MAAQQQQMEIRCIRFQYQKGTPDPPPFDTLPFYKIHIRSFLRSHFGHVMWLKGNAGKERAAWLLYDTTMAPHVNHLLSDPLDATGYFAVTATLDNAEDIITRYIRRKQMQVIGSLQLPDMNLGNKEPPKIVPEWKTIDWKKGFWKYNRTWSSVTNPDGRSSFTRGWDNYSHISASSISSKWITTRVPKGVRDKVVWKKDSAGNWYPDVRYVLKPQTIWEHEKYLKICLHNFEEYFLTYAKEGSPEDPQEKPPELTHREKPEFWTTESTILEWLDHHVSKQNILEAEPAWQQFQDTVKLPE